MSWYITKRNYVTDRFDSVVKATHAHHITTHEISAEVQHSLNIGNTGLVSTFLIQVIV